MMRQPRHTSHGTASRTPIHKRATSSDLDSIDLLHFPPKVFVLGIPGTNDYAGVNLEDGLCLSCFANKSNAVRYVRIHKLFEVETRELSFDGARDLAKRQDGVSALALLDAPERVRTHQVVF